MQASRSPQMPNWFEKTLLTPYFKIKSAEIVNVTDQVHERVRELDHHEGCN